MTGASWRFEFNATELDRHEDIPSDDIATFADALQSIFDARQSQPADALYARVDDFLTSWAQDGHSVDSIAVATRLPVDAVRRALANGYQSAEI